jgi:plastocyanin/uncharacterized membrane protein
MSRHEQHPHEYRSRSAARHDLTSSTIAPPLLQGCRFILSAVAVAIVSSVCVAALRVQPASGSNRIVVMKQMHFDPPQMTVQAGDTVEWKNEDIFSHTVTADDGSLDSGLIDPGQSWRMTFKDAQTLAYHCGPHPNMKAALVVQGTGEEQTQANAAAGAAHSAATLKWSPPRTPEELHPILVNFTAALLPLAFLSDILGRIFRRQSLHHAAWWMVLFTAAITPLTAAAGWWWKLKVGPTLPAKLITLHQWLGTSAVVLFVVLAVWRWNIHKRDASPGLAYLAFALIVVLALVYQGSLGGRMVFGQ